MIRGAISITKKSDRTWQNNLKLLQRRFRLDIRDNFFPGRVVSHWNRLPMVVMASPSLEGFTNGVDKALSDMV